MSISRRDFITGTGALVAGASAPPSSLGWQQGGQNVQSAQMSCRTWDTARTDAIIAELYPESLGKWDFGLTSGQEARAAKLHEESLIVDLVFQHPGGYRLFNREPFKSRAEELEKTASGLALIEIINFRLPYDLDKDLMRALWNKTGVTGGYLDLFLDMSDIERPQVHLEILAHVPWLHLALTSADIRAAHSCGEHFGIGYSQPVYGFSHDITLVERAYSRGLRSLLLTYNKTNVVGSGATETVDSGLTDFGKEIVRVQNELGMIVDVSHCGKKTTMDACTQSKAPVTSCHTNAEALMDHPRCKSDDELKAVAATGGLIGITAVPFFLQKDAATATINDILNHIDYVSDLIGWRHVGFGSDWPHTVPKSVLTNIFSPASQQVLGGGGAADASGWVANVQGFDDYLDYPNITRGLVKRGYSDEQIRGILGENFLRIFEEVCG